MLDLTGKSATGALIALLAVAGNGDAAELPRNTASREAQSAIRAPLSRYKSLPRFDTLIVNAIILDGLGNRMDGGEVAMRDGHIVAVGRNLPREGMRVIDAGGRWVTPGIIDVHTHYGTFLLPPNTADAGVTDIIENSDPNVADTWIEHAVHPGDPAFSRALASGVTTVQILPGSGALFGGRSIVVKTVPAVTVDDMRFPGAPQGLKMACGENPAGNFGSRGRFPNSRQGEIAGVRAAFLAAQRYQAEWDRYASGQSKDPPQTDLKLDTLAGALRGEIPVHLHCYRAEDIAHWIDVLQEFGIHIAAVHHATEAYKIAPLLRDAGVCAAVWSDWWGFKREAEDGIEENAAFVDAAGGCAIMHSDIPLLGGLLTLEAAKAAAAGRRAGLDVPPERAIRWITSNAASVLQLGDRIGRIAVGFNADVVLWSGSPFSIYSKPDLVFVDGAVAYDRSSEHPPVSDFELGRAQREPLP
ncbi:MAG: amidohydrolase family protein [Steroidobacteraceae bacterium]